MVIGSTLARLYINMSILITGYPYIRENYFKTLRHYPKKNVLFFLLPKIWKVKSGKIVYYPPADANVFKAKAFFYHSHYPIIGGLLKGWMPGFLNFIIRKRKSLGIRVVVTLTEPILLTTLYQALISKLFGLKHFLFTWENIDYKEKFKGINWIFKQLILKFNLYLSEGIICGNLKAVEIFKKMTAKPTPNIPFAGIDTDYFKPYREEKFFHGQDLREKIIYSFVGALEARKGVDLIIQAFKEVVLKIPNAHLLIAGTGEEKYEKELNKLVSEYNLQNKTTKVPWISHDELKHVLAITDVFVYPSLPYRGWEEQLGYLLMEAASAGLPTVSTDSGSIDEVIIGGQSGLLVKPYDLNELTQAMLKLGQDNALRQKFSHNAREHIVKNFSIEVIAKKFYDFLDKYDKEKSPF